MHLTAKEQRMVDLDSALWRGDISAPQQDTNFDLSEN